MQARSTVAERIIGVCALVVLASAFLPWINAIIISVRGIDITDGKIAAGCAIAGLALVAGRVWAGSSPVLPIAGSVILGVAVAVIGIKDMNAFAGIGLYLTMIGGNVWAAAAGYGLIKSRQATEEKRAPPRTSRGS